MSEQAYTGDAGNGAGAVNIPPPPAPLSLPRAWLDVLRHPSDTRFRQWFPYITDRWMVVSFWVSTALVVLSAILGAAHVLLFPSASVQSPGIEAIRAFIGEIIIPLAETIGFALLMALLMNRQYGMFRTRLRTYVLPTWLLAQPAISLVSFLATLVLESLSLLPPVSKGPPYTPTIFLGGCLILPLGFALAAYSLVPTINAFVATTGLNRWRIFLALAVGGTIIILPLYFVIYGRLPAL